MTRLTNHQPCALRLGTAKTTCGFYRAGFKASRGHAAPDIAAMVQEASSLCQTLSGVGVRLGRETPEKAAVLGAAQLLMTRGMSPLEKPAKWAERPESGVAMRAYEPTPMPNEIAVMLEDAKLTKKQRRFVLAYLKCLCNAYPGIGHFLALS